MGQDRRGPGARRADRDQLPARRHDPREPGDGEGLREAQEKRGSGDLLGELVQSAPTLNAKQFSSKEDLRTRGLEKVREAVGLVEAKATPEELDEYRTFAINVAQHAAEADKSGGFLGIGGERITGNEESALNEIAEALGTERPPAPASE